MRRKLALLNLVLLALLVWVGFRFQAVNAVAREREARVLNKSIQLEKFPPLPPIPAVSAAVAANYIEVPEKMLMASDRNSEVILDPVPEEKKPPMPPLPVAHGLMMFGDPGLILTEKPGAAQKTYRKGEKVGPFVLLAFDSKQVVFDWEGEKVERTLQELLEKPPAPGRNEKAAAAAPKPAVTQASPAVVNTSNTVARGPGQEVGGGSRACQPNDSSPAGTVRDGYRKVEVATPFGKSCKWEPVK